jgi:uncharacterized integral membrane protein
MGVYLKAIVLLIVLLFLTTFGIKNNQSLQIYYYLNVQTSPIPLYGIIYISIIIGIVIGMLVGISFRLILRRKVKILQEEINELKENTVKEKEEIPSTPSPIAEEDKG